MPLTSDADKTNVGELGASPHFVDLSRLNTCCDEHPPNFKLKNPLSHIISYQLNPRLGGSVGTLQTAGAVPSRENAMNSPDIRPAALAYVGGH